MATAVSWSVGTVLMFLGFGVMACSALGARRRSRFYIRLCCAGVVVLALALGLAFAIDFSALPGRALGPLWLALLLAALAVAPAFCYRTFRPLSKVRRMATVAVGPVPVRHRLRLARPRGGVPLSDADQARARRRDHNRPSLRGVSRRRAPVEPVRPRAPAGQAADRRFRSPGKRSMDPRWLFLRPPTPGQTGCAHGGGGAADRGPAALRAGMIPFARRPTPSRRSRSRRTARGRAARRGR